MKGEIDRDWYCITDYMVNHSVKCHGYTNENCGGCVFSHRKWPTPEQFKEEYGKEYPEDGAVYYQISNIDDEDIWGNGIYCVIKREAERLGKVRCSGHRFTIVCACTPWGIPPDDWRPGC